MHRKNLKICPEEFSASEKLQLGQMGNPQPSDLIRSLLMQRYAMNKAEGSTTRRRLASNDSLASLKMLKV